MLFATTKTLHKYCYLRDCAMYLMYCASCACSTLRDNAAVSFQKHDSSKCE